MKEQDTTRPEAPRRTWRHVAAAVGLFVLSPMIAEFLLGNIPIDKAGVAVLLAPMYGGGALFIRELARRTGRGWPTIAFLAAAYALLEEGLLTQLLFNPSYYGLELLDAAYVPVVGTGAHVTLTVLALHGVWSISVPIALVEALAPDRRGTPAPWLGRVGFTVAALVFAGGAAFVCYGNYSEERFLAAPGQLAGTAAVVAALAVAAFLVGRRPRARVEGNAPSPWLVGAVTLAGTSLFQLPGDSLAWLRVAVGVLVAAAVIVALDRWSRRDGWGQPHRLAAAGGALLTYCWYGFAETPIEATSATVDLIGNAVFATLAVLLLVVAVSVTSRDMRVRSVTQRTGTDHAPEGD